jgi:ABC-type lipoprotein release transport system permease subunit
MNTLKTLRRRYGRTSLTVTGIALAIAFTTIMLSVSEAITQSSKQILDETEVDLIAEYPIGIDNPLLQQFIFIFKLNESRTIANSMLENNSKIKAAAPWLMENVYVAKQTEVIDSSKPPKFALISAKGTIPESNDYFRGVDIIKGSRLPTRNDPFYSDGSYSGGTTSKNFTHEIIISKHLSKILEISVGDLIYLNPVGLFVDFTNQSIAGWYNNATWFNVSGIMVEQFEGQNSLAARLHLSELQYITGEHKNDPASKIFIKLHHESDREEVKKWLENEFFYKDRIKVYTTADLIENVNEILKIFEGFSTMVLIITILIAALFISTILMISTRERTKEIGALRAIGISKFTINKFIFKESFVICILGLIFGFIIGVIGSAVLNQYIITNFESLPSNIQVTVITPVLLIEVTIITMIIALLASLGPIYWAGKVNPADTIRME